MSKPNKRRQAKQKDRAESLRKRKATKPAARKVPLQDNYLTERAMRRALLMRDGKPFENEQDANSFLANALGEDFSVDELALDLVEANPVEHAQELAFQALAWQEDQGQDNGPRVDRLILKALDLDPNCIDAHLALIRASYESDTPIQVEGLDKYLALRTRHREGLVARWGQNLSKVPEVLLRPYHRFLGALLLEAPILQRNKESIDLALDAWRIGPNPEMAFMAVLTWLLAGKNKVEARQLFEILADEDGTAAGEMDELLWWHSWLVFQEGDKNAAQELYKAAVEAYPESDLYLFTNADTDPDLELDPDLFEDNHAEFGPLLEALAEDADFTAFGRALALAK